MAIDLSGLKRFKTSLEEVRVNYNPKNKKSFVSRILSIAREEIEKAYSGFKGIEVELVQNEDKYTFYVKDKKAKPTIAFDEFGTGFYAKGSYKGKLPTITLSFTTGSKQNLVVHTTNGWVYYYEDLYTTSKKTVNGEKGWFFGSSFTTGKQASNRMYLACKNVKSRIRSEIE